MLGFTISSELTAREQVTGEARSGSEAAGPDPCLCGWRYDVVRSGTKCVAAIAISLQVSRSYSAKIRRSYWQNLLDAALCRSTFRRIYSRKSHNALKKTTTYNRTALLLVVMIASSV